MGRSVKFGRVLPQRWNSARLVKIGDAAGPAPTPPRRRAAPARRRARTAAAGAGEDARHRAPFARRSAAGASRIISWSDRKVRRRRLRSRNLVAGPVRRRAHSGPCRGVPPPAAPRRWAGRGVRATRRPHRGPSARGSGSSRWTRERRRKASASDRSQPTQVTRSRTRTSTSAQPAWVSRRALRSGSAKCERTGLGTGVPRGRPPGRGARTRGLGLVGHVGDTGPGAGRRGDRPERGRRLGVKSIMPNRLRTTSKPPGSRNVEASATTGSTLARSSDRARRHLDHPPVHIDAHSPAPGLDEVGRRDRRRPRPAADIEDPIPGRRSARGQGHVAEGPEHPVEALRLLVPETGLGDIVVVSLLVHTSPGRRRARAVRRHDPPRGGRPGPRPPIPQRGRNAYQPSPSSTRIGSV